MTAPQILLGLLWAISLLLHARDHGKPKTGTDNFWVALLSTAIGISITYWGGFWSHK